MRPATERSGFAAAPPRGSFAFTAGEVLVMGRILQVPCHLVNLLEQQATHCPTGNEGYEGNAPQSPTPASLGLVHRGTTPERARPIYAIERRSIPFMSRLFPSKPLVDLAERDFSDALVSTSRVQPSSMSAQACSMVMR